MAAIPVTVATAETLSTTTDNVLLEVTFTNSEAFTYGAGPIYYYALLTDSTADTPLTQEVTFTLTQATGGTMAVNTPQTFNFENTQNLVPTITGSNGKIVYTPA